MGCPTRRPCAASRPVPPRSVRHRRPRGGAAEGDADLDGWRTGGQADGVRCAANVQPVHSRARAEVSPRVMRISTDGGPRPGGRCEVCCRRAAHAAAGVRAQPRPCGGAAEGDADLDEWRTGGQPGCKGRRTGHRSWSAPAKARLPSPGSRSQPSGRSPSVDASPHSDVFPHSGSPPPASSSPPTSGPPPASSGPPPGRPPPSRSRPPSGSTPPHGLQVDPAAQPHRRHHRTGVNRSRCWRSSATRSDGRLVRSLQV